MLDSQLKEKSTAMESYVRELSLLRNQVAKIKRNQERELAQLRETHTKELQQVCVKVITNCLDICKPVSNKHLISYEKN